MGGGQRLGIKRTNMRKVSLSSFMIFLFFASITSFSSSCSPRAREAVVSYQPRPWLTQVWKSEVRGDCPFEKSSNIVGIAFTRRYASYTDADTWYPSWASDGNMYSGWTDGEIGEESCHSSGGERAHTGNAKIIGDDPLNLQVISLGSCRASALPYKGRYPCANLVHNGIWYYATYCIDFDPDVPEYSWAVLGPVPGFRISYNYGKTWIDSPLSPEKPLFPESGKNGQKVKMGTPHFVDFGQNLEYSPDGKAYLVGHGASDLDPKPRKANLSWIAGDEIYLARVKPSPENINNIAKYEFFCGYDQDKQPRWSADFSKIKPVIQWNNRMGCVTMTYNAPLKKFLMCITDGWPGVKNMNTYILESDGMTGPWRLVTFMKDFGKQGYFVNFPSKFISPDGRTAWLCYSANFHQGYFTNRAVADPIGSRYALCLQEVRLLDAGEFEQYKDNDTKQEADPLKSSKNIALRARVYVSSVKKSHKPFTELVDYFGEGAVDGIVDLNTMSPRHEWASNGERESVMIRLIWEKPEKIHRVWLFDRPDTKSSHITSGLLVFSDGSILRVGELPDAATACKETSFPPKKVTWVAFLVNSVSEKTTDAGLAEMAVFSSDE
jgi:hypothetical protein